MANDLELFRLKVLLFLASVFAIAVHASMGKSRDEMHAQQLEDEHFVRLQSCIRLIHA